MRVVILRSHRTPSRTTVKIQCLRMDLHINEGKEHTYCKQKKPHNFPARRFNKKYESFTKISTASFIKRSNDACVCVYMREGVLCTMHA